MNTFLLRTMIIVAVLCVGMISVVSANDNCLLNNNSDQSSKLNSNSVDGLKSLWTIQSKDLITGKPLVDGKRVYFADWGGKVYAADVKTGKVLWQNAIETVQSAWAFHGFSGTGVLGKNTLYEASLEGNLFALDTKTGKVKWQVKFTDQPVSGNTGALMYYHGLVYVPVCSMDEGMDTSPGFVTNFQGRVEAFDAVTGKHVWEFKTVTGKENGVAVWSGFAVDKKTNTLYFDTGNNYTGDHSDMSDAIIAVNALTGELKWSKQCLTNDVWTMAQPKGPDYDFGAAPLLFDAKVNGKKTKLIAAGQKSGVLWVLDRTTGKEVWSAQLGAGAAGGGFLGSPSVNKEGIFAWANNAFVYSNPDQHKMDVAAYEPGTGKVLWKNTLAAPAWMTQAGFAAGNLYFVGSTDGIIRAFDTQNGKTVWKSEKMKSISTSLVVKDGKLFFGTGLPPMFGGTADGGQMNCMGKLGK